MHACTHARTQLSTHERFATAWRYTSTHDYDTRLKNREKVGAPRWECVPMCLERCLRFINVNLIRCECRCIHETTTTTFVQESLTLVSRSAVCECMQHTCSLVCCVCVCMWNDERMFRDIDSEEWNVGFCSSLFLTIQHFYFSLFFPLHKLLSVYTDQTFQR